MNSITESKSWKFSGFVALLLTLGIGGFLQYYLIRSLMVQVNAATVCLLILTLVALILMFSGLKVVQPNEACVLVFFGKYVGTIRESGLWWVNPFTTKKTVSLKLNNFNSEKLKVNDLMGNPIEIAAVIVWRVVDTAKAQFDVENYKQFVNVQCETAIRSVATQYPYDTHDESKASLRGSQTEISQNLRGQVQGKLEIAGVEVTDTRISHLAYAPEIAQTMLRRQQAEAIISARKRIVEGAVGMVETALQMLGERKILVLDDDKKAAMTNNLLVALISEHETTPIINAGTLYS
jgi:regulator of protease activity HflC (stomatin/prohibitin superfamily)